MIILDALFLLLLAYVHYQVDQHLANYNFQGVSYTIQRVVQILGATITVIPVLVWVVRDAIILAIRAKRRINEELERSRK
jgi:uncharacterized membrane protein YczE